MPYESPRLTDAKMQAIDPRLKSRRWTVATVARRKGCNLPPLRMRPDSEVAIRRMDRELGMRRDGEKERGLDIKERERTRERERGLRI